MSLKNNRKLKKGFTLIEMLVATAYALLIIKGLTGSRIRIKNKE